MAITNYGELKKSIADYMKRRDLDAVIPDFVQSTHTTLVEYAGNLSNLSNDEDTNQLLGYYPQAYLWGSLKEAALYVRDYELMGVYEAKFQQELSNLAMTGYDVIGISPNGPVV
jgi:hypothetical protein